MRINRFLARCGAASRRGAEKLVLAGRVSVNGSVVTELACDIDPEHDEVLVDGAPVTLPDEQVYLVLNKPAGYVTTMSSDDPHYQRTVAELVPTAEHPGLFPVGRLDADTTGLLLFMTDGELNHALLHPSHHVEKVYLALVDGPLTSGQARALEEGVEVDGAPTKPARLEQLGSERYRDARHRVRTGEWVRLAITEGRNHQVKKMFAAVGREVVDLHRESFGPIDLGDLAQGEWRLLDRGEVAALKLAAQVGGARDAR